MQRRLLIVSGLCLALWAASLVHPWARFAVQFLVNQVCHGVSGGKIGFTLLGLAVLCAVTAWRPARGSVSRCTRLLWITACGTGLGAALLSHLLYCRAYALPVVCPVFHWCGGLNSVNHIAHIHTSKAAIAASLELLGFSPGKLPFDSGAPYVEAVPFPLIVVTGVCFLVGLALLVRVVPRLAWRYPPTEAPIAAVIGALAALALCRSILDGGPLAYDVPAAAIVGLALMQADSLRGAACWLRRNLLRVLAAVLGWVAALGLAGIALIPHQLGHFAYRLALYGLVLLLGYRGWHGLAERRVVRLGVLLCAVTMAYFLAGAVRSDWLPFFQIAPPQAVRFIRPDECVAAAASQAHPLCAERVAAGPGESALALYLRLGENPTRTRCVSLRRDATAEPTGFLADLVLLRTRGPELQLIPSSFLSFERFEPAGESSPPRFHVQIRFVADFAPVLWRGPGHRPDQIDENERFVAYTILDQYLRAAGVEEYILIPWAQYVGDPRHDAPRLGARASSAR